MNTRIRCALAIACMATLGACAERKEPEPMPVEETVFADQVQTIERTKEQVREMEGRMQDLNRQLDASEGAAPREEDEAPGN